MVPNTPFPCSYWVDPDNFLAGEYPGARSAGVARRKFQSLIDCGIRHIINLMVPDERDFFGNPFRPYEPMAASIPAGRGAVICRRYPIRDMGVPDTIGMQTILDAIDDALNARRPVYVHCLAGVGRTGTVVGCWLIRHGRATGDDVIDVIQRLRQRDPHAHWPSPQSTPQRDMVRRWRLGQ